MTPDSSCRWSATDFRSAPTRPDCVCCRGRLAKNPRLIARPPPLAPATAIGPSWRDSPGCASSRPARRWDWRAGSGRSWPAPPDCVCRSGGGCCCAPASLSTVCHCPRSSSRPLAPAAVAAALVAPRDCATVAAGQRAKGGKGEGVATLMVGTVSEFLSASLASWLTEERLINEPEEQIIRHLVRIKS